MGKSLFSQIQTSLNVSDYSFTLGFLCAGRSIKFILGDAATSVGEMLHFIYRMGEWGQFWAERTYKEEAKLCRSLMLL